MEIAKTADEAETTQEDRNQEDNNGDSISGGSISTINLESNTNELSRPNQNELQVMLRDLDQKLDKNNAMIKRIEESIPSLYDRLDKIYNDVLSSAPKKKEKKGKKKKGKDSKSPSKNAAAKSEKKDNKMRTKSKNKSGGKKAKNRNK
jgi:hypothetical protein